MTDTPHRVLLTGAAGRIGAAFYEYAQGRYAFRLADRIAVSPAPGDEATLMDIADAAQCRTACAGMDTVVHLAANASPDADFYGSLLDSNIKGAYNVFRAAKDAGCRRVVFASSAQAMEGYPLDVQVSSDTPVHPKSMYGVSKCFGEAVASYFAFQENLPSVCVRIANFQNGPPPPGSTARDLSAYLSKRDCCHLLTRCIETPSIVFAIAHGVSNNRFKRLDITLTEQVLGYEPQDDAFQSYGFTG